MPAHDQDTTRVLSDAKIEQFIQDGFVKVEGAFPASLRTKAAPFCGAICRAVPAIPPRGPGRSSGLAVTAMSHSRAP
jgi:hypothetical protein